MLLHDLCGQRHVTGLDGTGDLQVVLQRLGDVLA